MKKNSFTTLLKATAVLASIGGLAYVFRDKIMSCPVVSSLKEKLSGSEEDIFDEENYFEENTDDNAEDVASREYVSLDIESTKENDDESMTLEEMEDAIEEEIQLENTLENETDSCEETQTESTLEDETDVCEEETVASKEEIAEETSEEEVITENSEEK